MPSLNSAFVERLVAEVSARLLAEQAKADASKLLPAPPEHPDRPAR
ncbi:hypothetical protein [Cereibacter sphaeroides]|nr:hypothetical protein [Cereibacter sphaeroides]